MSLGLNGDIFSVEAFSFCSRPEQEQRRRLPWRHPLKTYGPENIKQGGKNLIKTGVNKAASAVKTKIKNDKDIGRFLERYGELANIVREFYPFK